MKKGIWWLFGGICLSAIVFAILLATNVVNLRATSQKDNNGDVKEKNGNVCKIDKKIDGVDYSFTLNKINDKYFLSVYVNKKWPEFLYNAAVDLDLDYLDTCDYDFTEYVKRKLITSEGNYDYYLYYYPYGPDYAAFVIVNNKDEDYLHTVADLGYAYSGIFSKIEDGKKDYNTDELSTIEDNIHINDGKLYIIDSSYISGNVNIVGCGETNVYDEFVYEFANGTFTKKKSGLSYFEPQVKC